MISAGGDLAPGGKGAAAESVGSFSWVDARARREYRRDCHRHTAVVRYWMVDFRHGSFGAVAFFVFFPLAVCAADAALLLREIIALDCSVYLVYLDYLNWSAYSATRITRII